MGLRHLGSSVYVPIEYFVDQSPHFRVRGQVCVTHPHHGSLPASILVVAQHLESGGLDQDQFLVSFEFLFLLVVVVECVVVSPKVLELIIGGSSEVVEDLLM